MYDQIHKTLLIIRCPFKPLGLENTAHATNIQDENFNDLLIKHKFAWHLSDANRVESTSGVGSIESMPYADQVLILIPTLNVQLLELKLPLVSDKKLLAILPGLLGDYLIGESNDFYIQLLPNISESLANHRVVALIDRAWLGWLGSQFGCLLAKQIQLVPDCYLLKPILTKGNTDHHDSDQIASVAFEHTHQGLVFTVRQTEFRGVSWVEADVQCQQHDPVVNGYLPSQLEGQQPILFDWPWVSRQSDLFLKNDVAARINLLPKSFLSSHLGSAWKSPAKWASIAITSITFGFAVHLLWMLMVDWRWSGHMQHWAASYVQSTPDSQPSGAPLIGQPVQILTRQMIQQQRSHGVSTQADLGVLLARLEELSPFFKTSRLSSVSYNGYSVDVLLAPSGAGAAPLSAPLLVAKAGTMGMHLIALGEGRFRLLPYSGIGDAI